jgi:hypothetical protein
MAKLIAILHVVVWAGFWAFGYLAFTASHDGQMVTAAIFAAIGAAAGVGTWFWLVRHSEEIGYAAKPRRAYPKSDEGDTV